MMEWKNGGVVITTKERVESGQTIREKSFSLFNQIAVRKRLARSSL